MSGTPWNPGDLVSIDSTLERTTEFVVNEDGSFAFSTSSTDGVSITRVAVGGTRHDEQLEEEDFETVMDGLYDAGYSS